MIVRKFGGTSVKDATQIKRTVEIIKNYSGKQIVVVSAFSGITNLLVKITELLKSRSITDADNILEEIRVIHLRVINDLLLGSDIVNYVNNILDDLKRIIYALDVIGEITNKSKDKLFSTGEILSSYIIASYCEKIGLKAKHFDARNLIITDSIYTEAEVDFELTNANIKDAVIWFDNDTDTIICGGFIGSDKYGCTTTLGRGGSDYSAAVISKCCIAERLEIWTDVDGILTSDPRLIPNARLISEISYNEAAELAYFGAKVLHPKTIYPAIENEIPVYVLNTFNPASKGTLIRKTSGFGNIIKAIAFRKNITVINITSNRMLGAYGFLAKVFDVFLMNETSVDLVTTSEVSISLTIDNTKNIESIRRDLSSFAMVEIHPNKAIISVVGEGIRNTSGIASKFFGSLEGINILMISMGASEINLSIIVSDEELSKAVGLLHKEFFESENLPELFIELKKD